MNWLLPLLSKTSLRCITKTMATTSATAQPKKKPADIQFKFFSIRHCNKIIIISFMFLMNTLGKPWAQTSKISAFALTSLITWEKCNSMSFPSDFSSQNVHSSSSVTICEVLNESSFHTFYEPCDLWQYRNILKRKDLQVRIG